MRVCWEQMIEPSLSAVLKSHLQESFSQNPGGGWRHRVLMDYVLHLNCQRWTLEVRDVVNLKGSYLAMLAYETPEAAGGYQQAKRAAAWVGVVAKTQV